MQLQVPLLENNQNQEKYDPYLIPANIQIAKNHQKATRVGLPNYQELQMCPCCNNPVNNQSISLMCSDNDLSFLGCGYAFYFYFIKIIIFLFAFLFMLGGTVNILIINVNCNDQCAKILGIGIFNYYDLVKRLNTQSWNNTIITFFMIWLVLRLKPMLYNKMAYFNQQSVNISQYSVMVANIPLQTEAHEIAEFFENFTKQKVVKVNLAYDCQEYSNLVQKQLDNENNLKKQEYYLKRLEDGITQNEPQNMQQIYQEKINSLKFEIQKFQTEIEAFTKECHVQGVSQKFVGTAFVTFDSQLPVKILLEHWGVTYFRNLKYFFLNSILQPYTKFKNQTILIYKAPAPSDIIWENLRFSFMQQFCNYIVLYFATIIILVVSFNIQWHIILMVYEARQEIQEQQGQNGIIMHTMQANLVSLFIIATNSLLRVTVKYFTTLQKHFCMTQFNSSFINIYIFLNFFNSALMPYIVYSFNSEQKKNPEQLAYDIHLILISNSFSHPLLRIIDLNMIVKSFQRWRIIRQGQQSTYTQNQVNTIFEGHQFDIAESYAYIVRLLFLTFWFASVAPMGIIFSSLGIALNYWVDKYQLIKMNIFPQHQNEQIIIKIVDSLEFLPYFYIFGAMQFTQKTLVTDNLIDYLFAIVVYGISSTLLIISLNIYLVFYKKRVSRTQPSELKYDEAKYLFLNEYDRTNPITQKNAQKEWIQFLKKGSEQLENQDKSEESYKLFKQNVIELSRRRSNMLQSIILPKQEDHVKQKIIQMEFIEKKLNIP